MTMSKECIEALKSYDKIDNTLCLNNNRNNIEFSISEDENLDCKNAYEMVECLDNIKQALVKAQENKKILKIIKEKCLHNDNLNYMAVCINYDMYKERMSKRYDTKVVKTNWNDKDLLDYLKLLTEEEFNLLKELV